MTASFTPGPWKVLEWELDDEYHIGVTALSTDVAHCGGFYSAKSREEVLANATLIAAAPDMLAALEDITDRYRSAIIAGGTDAEYADIAVKQFRAAIKKARGQ